MDCPKDKPRRDEGDELRGASSSQTRPSNIVLMADDDPDDRLLTALALKECGSGDRLITVTDGTELLDYLRRVGRFADPASSPRPRLILLDLNMPNMDGPTTLAELQKDPDLKAIPVAVMTTSMIDGEIRKSFGLGARSFFQKPVTFESLVSMMKSLTYLTEVRGSESQDSESHDVDE